MNLPKSVNVYGEKIKVKLQDLKNHSVAGFFDGDKNLIVICNSLKGNDLLLTFLHEVSHAIWSKSGMRQMHCSSDVEEMTCENIPNWIVKNFDLKLKNKKS